MTDLFHVKVEANEAWPDNQSENSDMDSLGEISTKCLGMAAQGTHADVADISETVIFPAACDLPKPTTMVLTDSQSQKSHERLPRVDPHHENMKVADTTKLPFKCKHNSHCSVKSAEKQVKFADSASVPASGSPTKTPPAKDTSSKGRTLTSSQSQRPSKCHKSSGSRAEPEEKHVHFEGFEMEADKSELFHRYFIDLEELDKYRSEKAKQKHRGRDNKGKFKEGLAGVNVDNFHNRSAPLGSRMDQHDRTVRALLGRKASSFLNASSEHSRSAKQASTAKSATSREPSVPNSAGRATDRAQQCRVATRMKEGPSIANGVQYMSIAVTIICNELRLELFHSVIVTPCAKWV